MNAADAPWAASRAAEPRSAGRWSSSHARRARIGGRVAFDRLVAALIRRGVWTTNLRLEYDAVAASTAEVFDRSPALVGVLLEEGVESCVQPLDHVRPHRLVEHRGGTHLHRATAQQDVRERLREIGDPPDAGERAVR